MTPKRFNIRVYGIWLNEGRILINEELIRGSKVIKLPGGGLEWGEGIRECLIREWKEELNIDIEVHDHFYTTDFFQHSAFDDSQVISIYYWVSSLKVPEKIINYMENERTYWVDASSIRSASFTLPIDQVVGEMIENYLKSQ
jgi:ADP-ribose pyrophosphatase YjhB (NUDIX family)